MRKMTGMAYVYQWYATVNLGTIRFTASSLLRCCKIWNQERIRMINNLMCIELKMGYSDDDPAWIGYVKTSKSKKTIYFNDHAFQKNIGNYANYIDIENGDKYWISGLKKEESNRHWAGHGKIMIDRRAVNEYLFLIGEKELPLNLFEVVDIEDRFPVKRVKELLNEKK